MGEYVPTPNRAVHEKFLVIYDTRDDYLFINFDVSAIADVGAPDNHVLLTKSNINMTLMHNFILPNIIRGTKTFATKVSVTLSSDAVACSGCNTRTTEPPKHRVGR